MNIGAATYTNMIVTVGTIVSAPNGTSPNGPSDIYLPLANELVVPDVNVGSNQYFNVIVTLTGLVSLGGVSGADSYDGSDLSIPLVAVGGAYVIPWVVPPVTTANIVQGGGARRAWRTMSTTRKPGNRASRRCRSAAMSIPT